MNYERATTEFFADQKGTQEEMNDIEESLSSQENKMFLGSILWPLTYPVVWYVKIKTIKMQWSLSREHCLSYTLLQKVVEFLKRWEMELNTVLYSILEVLFFLIIVIHLKINLGRLDKVCPKFISRWMTIRKKGSSKGHKPISKAKIKIGGSILFLLLGLIYEPTSKPAASAIFIFIILSLSN